MYNYPPRTTNSKDKYPSGHLPLRTITPIEQLPSLLVQLPLGTTTPILEIDIL